MTPDVIAEYDSSRKIADKPVRSICYAAHANLFFAMDGNVRPCCWSKQPYGNVQCSGTWTRFGRALR